MLANARSRSRSGSGPVGLSRTPSNSNRGRVVSVSRSALTNGSMFIRGSVSGARRSNSAGWRGCPQVSGRPGRFLSGCHSGNKDS